MKKTTTGTTTGTNCKLCNHRRAREEVKAGGHALIWGCPVHKIRFGYTFEYEQGKKFPADCADFKPEEWCEVVK